ncbi:MAG TPA: efflux RND transporter permease subunit [Bacteroidota bacterium]|nr:efflux RND transporter permease subunit [Bacteroidota bacterium]
MAKRPRSRLNDKSNGKTNGKGNNRAVTKRTVLSPEHVEPPTLQIGGKRTLANWAISHPIGTLLIISVIIVLGGYFLSTLQVDLLPKLIYPQIRVSVSNRGVDPLVMEETVTRVLESRLATTEDVTKVESSTSEGRSNITLSFDYSKNIDLALRDASTKLDQARAGLPREVDPPVIWKADPSQIPIFELAVSSSSFDLVKLRRWCQEELADYFMTVAGVASVDVAGGLEREVQVILDQKRLQGYGLSVSEVLRAIRDANVDQTGGRVTAGRREYLSRTEGKITSVEQLRSVAIPVRGQFGQQRIRLSDIARVEDSHREQRIFARLNGIPSVKISIQKQPNANTVEVIDGLKAKMEFLAANNIIPAGLDIKIVNDQSYYIKNSISSVTDAAMVGGLLAMIVVGFFLGSWKRTFVIASSIPIAILGTFMMMGLGNLTLNIISLGGLALGIGMLVDNSIVMLENISRHQREHPDPVEAAHFGSNEVLSAVVASTTTNLASVLPFLLIVGLAALFFKELILTISFAIVASLLVAITLVPMLSAQLFKYELSHQRKIPVWAQWSADWLARVTERYRKALQWTIHHRTIVLSTILALFVGSILLAGQLGSEFLPYMDDGRISIRIEMPPSTSVFETNAVATRLEEIIETMPARASVFSTVGGFIFGRGTAEFANRGSVDIQLVPLKERTISSNDWIAEIRKKIAAAQIPEARILVSKPQIRGIRTSSGGSDVSVKIQGPDLTVLASLANEAIARLRDLEGLSNLNKSVEEAKPELRIQVDRERAAELGISIREIGETIRTAIDGTIASKYTEGDREYDIRVLLDRSEVTSLRSVEELIIYPPMGPATTLRSVARVREGIGPVTITRENQNRIVEITGDVTGTTRTIGEVTADVHARLDQLELPAGYSIFYGGQEETMKESNRDLIIIILLAIFLVYVVMGIQYESLLNPFVILTTIPFALIGVIVGLYVTNIPVGATVMLGVILLAGIVVNNSILLVEFIEIMRREKGMSKEEAALAAGPVRLRPIMMTTLTTVVGMLPLALGIGEGSEVLQPLAVSTIGGLLAATIISLLVIPNVYLALHDFRERFFARFGRKGSIETLPTLPKVIGEKQAESVSVS